ncbi:MAG: zinc ribbon domain-containing protein [Candidatus Acidiferrales bacterium]
MSRFRDELKVIPGAARFIAILGYIVATTMFFLLVTLGSQKDMADLPKVGKFFLTVCPGLILAIWVLLIGYVYGDSKRRGMRHVMWTLLAIFIPNMIGVILYFILRDPLMKKCPGCGESAKSGFTFCPRCGTALQPTCPNCGRAVELGWSNCPHCGTRLPSGTVQVRTA